MDITEHLNNLKKTLQGRKKVVTQYYDSIHAFKLKLTLWETQLSGGDPACMCAPRVNVNMTRYKDKITGLLQEFEQRFQIFGQLKTDFTVFCSPFTVNA